MRRVYTTALATLALLGAAQAQANYTKTKHPIVLVHGITGFDTIGGLVNYFHTIPWNLERDGAKVHIASVAAFNDSEQRGAELARQIVPWAAAGGAGSPAARPGSSTATSIWRTAGCPARGPGRRSTSAASLPPTATATAGRASARVASWRAV